MQLKEYIFSRIASILSPFIELSSTLITDDWSVKFGAASSTAALICRSWCDLTVHLLSQEPITPLKIKYKRVTVNHKTVRFLWSQCCPQFQGQLQLPKSLKMDKHSGFIEEMTQMLIRPHRDTYTIDKLGPSMLIIKSQINSNEKQFKYVEVHRNDMTLQSRGHSMQVSMFSSKQDPKKHGKQQPAWAKSKCVVYLHANSGSRQQGLELVKLVLPHDCKLVVFDFVGSGVSGGEYTSMGVGESEDLQTVLLQISKRFGVSEFTLWGRSMGAVTAIYYLTKQYLGDHQHSGIVIRSIVLDSPFASLQRLMYDIANTKTRLPQFIFVPIVSSIGQRVETKIGFNLLKQLDLPQRIKALQQKQDHFKIISRVKALFLTSKQDQLVNHQHVETLHQCFPFYPKELHYFSGQHSQPRSEQLKQKCTNFLCEQLMRSSEGFQPFKAKSSQVPKVFKQEGTKEGGQKDKAKHFLMGNFKKVNQPASPKLEAQNRTFTEVSSPTRIFKEHPKQKKIVDELKSQVSRESKQQPERGQRVNQSPSIIINKNNYNVSINVYPTADNNIPPINLANCVTDRLNDEFFNKLSSYSAKVQKGHTQYSNGKDSFISQPASTKKMEGQGYGSVGHEEPQKDWEKRLQRAKGHNHKPSITQHQDKMDIPMINFKGMQADWEWEELGSARLEGNKSAGLPKAMVSPSSSSNQANCPDNMVRSQPFLKDQKAKLSLSEMRKMQKKEHEQKAMKVSKFIREEQNTKVVQGQTRPRMGSGQQEIRQDVSRCTSNDFKSMKTSLIRKGIERTNSRNIPVAVRSSQGEYQSFTPHKSYEPKLRFQRNG